MVFNLVQLDPPKWSFEYSQRARDQFKKLDKQVQRRIDQKIERIIQGQENPWHYAKRLTGNLSHLHSIRIDDYRLICRIDQGKTIIIAMYVGHRREVYQI